MPRKIKLADDSILEVPDGATNEQIDQQVNYQLNKDYGTSWFIGGHPAKAELGPDNKPSAYSVYDKNNPSQLKVRVPPSYNTPDIEEMLGRHNLYNVDLVKNRETNPIYKVLPPSKEFEGNILEAPAAKLLDLQHYANYKPGQRPEERFIKDELPGLAKFASLGPSGKAGVQVFDKVASSMPPTPVGRTIAGLAGAGTAAATYLASRKAIDPNDTVDQAAWDAILSEVPITVLGKIISGGRAVAEHITDPKSIIGKKLAELPLTYSQLRELMAGQKQNLTKIVEDLFATKVKATTQKEAAEFGVKKGQQIAADIVSGPGVANTGTMPAPIEQAKKIRENIVGQLGDINKFSSTKAKEAEGVAKTSVFTIPNEFPKDAQGLSPYIEKIPGGESIQLIVNAQERAGIAPVDTLKQLVDKNPAPNIKNNLNKVIQQIESPGRAVEGPIHLTKTLEELNSYVQEVESSILPNKTENVLYKQAKEILNSTNAKFDELGKVVSSEPIPFREAWEHKKTIGESYKKATEIDPNIGRGGRFNAGQFKSINDDIENSFKLPAWDNQVPVKTVNGEIQARAGDAAKDAWQQSKEAVVLRKNLFGKNPETGELPIPEQIRRKGLDPSSVIEDIFSSPDKVKSLLTTNKIVLPDGSILLSNGRREAAGLLVDSWFEGKIKDGLFDTTKAILDLKNPNKEVTRRLLFSDGTQKEWLGLFDGFRKAEDLIKNLSVAERPNAIANSPYYNFIWPARIGLMVAPNLVTGALSGSSLTHIGVAGIALSGSVLAHLMSKPATAKIMAALANGKKLGSDEFISRVLVNSIKAIKGHISVVDDKGIAHPFTINANGEAVPGEQ